jgi:hypothetical protein
VSGSLGTGEGSATASTKAKTIAELRKEKLIQKKGDELPNETSAKEEETKDDASIQAKQELSSWNVDATGKLNTLTPAIQKAEDDKELQKKEEEQKEDEKINAGPVNAVQKKEAEGFAEREAACSESSTERTSISLQAKSETESSSLTDKENAPAQEIRSEQDRGPPSIQMKSEEEDVVQRSVIDDAFTHTSLSDLAGCLSTDSNETSVCLLRKASAIAMYIPGYKALRVVLGRDPISGDDVERNGRNLLEAAFDIMPFGNLLKDKLDAQGQLEAAATWIDGKIAGLESIVNDLFSEFDQFWNGIEFSITMSPMGILREGAGIVLRFINKVIDFAVDAAKELLEMIKTYLLDAIVTFIKEKTTAYPLLIVILCEDPITKQKVDRNGTNILNALLELGGEEGKMQRDQMMETGTFQKVVAYIDEGIAVFGNLYETIIGNFDKIWKVVSIEALMNPVDTFTEIYNTFAQPVIDVLAFVEKVVKEILKLVKDALFKRISAEAKKTKGYYLVTVLINKDPFTGEVVPRTVENLIHGFMSLMDGGEEQFQQMKESGAIDKAVNKINAAVERLNMTFESVVQLFIDLWNSFTFSDFVHPIATFQRIIATFGEPIGRLIAFVVEIVKIVVEVILIIMNFPFDLINNIIAKAMKAFELIKKNPIGFLKNLLRAIKEGFMQFFDNILTHLWNGLKQWFLGEVEAAGIPIPTDFTVMGIIKWLLAVLDITMEKIWKKLEERIGKPKVDKLRKMIDMAEKVAGAAGEAYEFMKDVQERGFMAVMIDKVKEQLSNVWEMVLDAVKSFVMDQIIKKVTVKLLSMLDPTGIMAVINSAIALYKAIQSFIKYLRKMLEIVNSFVEGTLQIAQGATKKAADFLEGALGRGIPIVIGFLANQVGLDLSGRLKEALEIVREKVDKGLTWVIDKLVVIVEKLVSMGKAAISAVIDWWKKKKEVTTKDGEKHTIYLEGSGSNYKLMIRSTPENYRQFILNTLNKNGITAPVPGSDEEKALNKAAEIDTKLGNYDKVKQEDRQVWGDELAKMIDDLADLTAKLKINLNVPDPPSVIRWGGPNAEGFGTMMSADLLSENYVKGEPAAEESVAVLGWDYARSLQKISKKGAPTPIYVKGHLLNENLGGPANVTNLTPITGDMNKEHLNKVEKHVKKLVLGKESAADKSPTAKKVVNYTVDVKYDKHPQRTGLITTYSDIMWKSRRDHAEEKRKSSPDTKKLSEFIAKDEMAMNVLALLTYEENSLTTGFGCQWEQLQYNAATAKWEPVAGTQKNEPVNHTLPSSVEHYKPVFDTYKTDIK